MEKSVMMSVADIGGINDMNNMNANNVVNEINPINEMSAHSGINAKHGIMISTVRLQLIEPNPLLKLRPLMEFMSLLS